MYSVLLNTLLLIQTSLTGSCYSTIAITIERFLSIRLPFFIQKHNIKARLFILPVMLFAILYNLPRFFEYQIVYQGCIPFPNGTLSSLEYDQSQNLTCSHSYILDYSEMRETQLYISVTYNFVFPNQLIFNESFLQLYVNSMSLIFNTLLPLLTLTILNYMTYQAIQKSIQLQAVASQVVTRTVDETSEFLKTPCRRFSSRQRSSVSVVNKINIQKLDGLRSHGSSENTVRKIEARITKASIGITIMFLICHTPRVIPNLFEVLVDQSTFPKVGFLFRVCILGFY